jgi:hypothetical protein
LALGGAACAKGAGSKQAFCNELRSIPDPGQLFRRVEPANAGTVAAADRAAAERLGRLELAAPRSIKPDVATMADLEADVADVVEKYGYDRGLLRLKLFELAQQRIGSGSSLVKVSDYARNECGIDLGRRSAGRDSATDGSPYSTDSSGPFGGYPASSTVPAPTTVPRTASQSSDSTG